MDSERDSITDEIERALVAAIDIIPMGRVQTLRLLERALASRRVTLASHGTDSRAVAWRSTTNCFKRFVTDDWYQRQPPGIRRWYEPYRCASCVIGPAASEEAKGVERRGPIADQDMAGNPIPHFTPLPTSASHETMRDVPEPASAAGTEEPTHEQIALLDPWMRPESARELLRSVLAIGRASRSSEKDTTAGEGDEDRGNCNVCGKPVAWGERHRQCGDAVMAAESSGSERDRMLEEAALPVFVEWFVRNYPGPDTIIRRPEWHAPKVFRAALHALNAARALKSTPSSAVEADGGDDAKDAARFRWLTEDHADREVRERVRSILGSMGVCSYSSACISIDANMAAITAAPKKETGS